MKDKLPLLLVLLAAVLWGTTGTAQTFAPDNTHPTSFGAMRLAIGGLTLLIFAYIRGTLHLKNWPLKVVAIAAFSIAFYQPLFFSAVKITGVAIGTVVAIGSSPIFAGIMEGVIKKKLPNKTWWIATTMAIIGCVLLFKNDSAVQVEALGILLALGAGLSFALYTIVSKELLRTHTSESVVAVVFTLSAILLTPFLFLYDLSWIGEWSGMAASLYIGIISTGLAYLFFIKGLVRIPASSAVTLSLFEPLTAALLGAFLVGETLSIQSWVGVSCIFLAIVVISFIPKKSKANLSKDQFRNIVK